MGAQYYRTFDGVPIYPTASDLPAYSAVGTFAAVGNPVSLYQFNGSSWDVLAATTGAILGTTITGLSLVNSDIVDGDSIVEAFGKAQGQVDNLDTRLGTVSGNLTTVSGNLTTVSGNLATVSGNLSTVSGNLATVSGDLDTVEIAIANQVDQNVDTFEPTGFPVVSTYLAYNAASGIVTVGNGSYEFWVRGTKFSKTTESVTHATGTGRNFITYGLAGNIQSSTSVFDFSTQAMVAFCYRNETQSPKGYCTRETHGLMPWQSHIENHEINGAYRVSGFTCTGYTVRTGSPATDQPLANSELDFTIDAGVHADEDLRNTVAAFTAGSNHTHFYRLGSDVGWNVSGVMPYPMGTTYPQYNQNVAGNWQLTEITAPTNSQGRWFNVFAVVQQCATGSEDFEHLWIPGQAQFDSQSAALTETWDTIDKSAFPSPELVPIAQVTYRADPRFTAVTGRVRMEVFTPIFGTRSSRISVAGFSPTAHPTLTNRDAASQHPSTAIGPWEWASGANYDASVGVEHTVTHAGMLFRCASNHTAASAFNDDWNQGYWSQIGLPTQNFASNYSGVSDNYGAQTFPAVASGQSCSITFDSTVAYLFEVSLGSGGEGVVIGCDFKASGINCLSDPSSVFSDTVAANKLSVTKSANSAVVVIRNNVGTRNIAILPVRARISAMTAWA